MNKTAAIYARVSSDRQKESHTIGSQTSALVEYAQTHGYAVPSEWVFQDEGYSGASLVRPGLEALRDLAGQRVMRSVTRFLTRRLKLKVNEAKSAGARPEERKFLGFSFSNNKEPKRRIAPKTLLRCKQKIRELTQRTRGISLEQMMKDLAAYLRGWKSYFGFCQTPSLLKALEEWIRRRLRSMIWKQWKRGKQRYAQLRHLGINEVFAAQTAGSPHGPWRLANSTALSYA